jgi:hypothetical protein
MHSLCYRNEHGECRARHPMTSWQINRRPLGSQHRVTAEVECNTPQNLISSSSQSSTYTSFAIPPRRRRPTSPRLQLYCTLIALASWSIEISESSSAFYVSLHPDPINSGTVPLLVFVCLAHFRLLELSQQMTTVIKSLRAISRDVEEAPQ